MNLRKHLIYFIWVIIMYGLTSPDKGHAQCSTSVRTVIKDEENDAPDTTLVKIVIENAVNNQLAHPLQGLCAVGIRFKHPFVKELTLELISPAGQMVRLTGGNISAYFTGFVTWDVKFVQSPPDGIAAPDPGFSEIWDNDQDWENFKTYKGDYYPHTGRLQNFNTGPVNGTWTLRCIDFADFGEGEILSFQLFFCDDEGLKCTSCRLDPGYYPMADFESCSGSQDLLIDRSKQFAVHPPVQGSSFVYSNIIFRDQIIQKYEVIPDLRMQPPGHYTICPIQYAPVESAKLPAAGSSIRRDTINRLFTNACALVSDSCLSIIIEDNVQPLILDSTICAGDSVVIHNQVFREKGKYTIRIPNGVCDSLVELNLRVNALSVVIEADKDSLNCFNNTIALIANVTGSAGVNTYAWSGKNHPVNSDPGDFIVDISKPDIYFVTVSSAFGNVVCTATDSIMIPADSSVPATTLSADTITCRNTQTEIRIASSRLLVSTTWESEDGSNITPTGLNALVTQPGKYKVIAVADNGCAVVDSIWVQEDKTLVSPVILADTLSCKQTEVQVRLENLMAGRSYTFMWTGVAAGSETLREPLVQQHGTITLMLTDEINGCSGMFTAEITKDTIPPEILQLETDTLSCSRTTTQPLLTTDVQITDYIWTGPGLQSNAAIPTFSQPGLYQVRLTGPNGCIKDSIFRITADTSRAEVSLSAPDFDCNTSEIRITVSSDITIVHYVWSGPENFSSSSPQPVVTRPGLYSLTATASNGCVTQASIQVRNNEDIPFVFFEADPIDCRNERVTVNVTETQGRTFTYNWSGPGIVTPSEKNPVVDTPGLYTLTVTDVNTGCTADFVLNIEDNRKYAKITLQSEILNCIKDSIPIILTSDMPLAGVTFMGPDGFAGTNPVTYVRKEGWYFVTATNEFHCVTLDSILIERNDRLPVISTDDYRIICRQDSILLSANSDMEGTEFLWTGPSGFSSAGQTVYAYQGGTYTLTGIAPNQCKGTLSFEIQYDTLKPDLSILPFNPLTCREPKTEVTATSNTPGLLYSWSGQETHTGNPAQIETPGFYLLTATAPNQCEEQLMFEVTESKNYPQYTITADTLNCRQNTGAVSLSTSGAHIVLWDNANPLPVSVNVRTFSTTQPGIYRFSIINDEQCITTGQMEVVQDNQIPDIKTFSADSITCENAVVIVGVTSGVPVESFTWNGPGNIELIGPGAVLINEEGQYSLRITGKNGCVKDTSFTIIKNREIPVFTTFTDTLTCDKGKINIGVNPVSNVVSYLWNGPDAFVSISRNPIVFNPGEYRVTVSNSNGCSATAVINVEADFKKPEIQFPDEIRLPCDGTAASLHISSASSILRYRWTFPDGSTGTEANPLTKGPGTYAVQIVGLNGCLSDTKTFNAIKENKKPTLDLRNDTLTCIKSTGILRVNALEESVKFTWIRPDSTTSPGNSLAANVPGDYTLIARDSLLCSDTLMIKLVSDTLRPPHIIRQYGGIVCESVAAELAAEGGIPSRNYSFSWSTTNGIITSASNVSTIKAGSVGDYRLVITDLINGCINVKEYVLTESEPTLTDIKISVFSPGCPEYQNGRVSIDSLNGVPPYTLLFNGQNAGSVNTFGFLSPGSYRIEIKDALGCRLDTLVNIEAPLDPFINLPSETGILFGDSVTLMPEIFLSLSEGWQSQWSSTGAVICSDCPRITVMPFVNTLYTFSISLDGRCQRSASVLVKVKNDLNTSVPNIFRPGSGSGNELFYIPQIRGIEKILSVKIFDKWAEPVFASFDHLPGDREFGWDGTFKGREAVPGVYVVVAEMILSNGQRYKYVGDLTLLR